MNHQHIRIIVLLFLFLFAGPMVRAQYSWKILGNLREARSQFSTISLGNGEVLIIGGFAGKPDFRTVALATCEMISMRDLSITEGASMNTRRAETVALMTPDSNVVVLGGEMNAFERGTVTPTVELYDRRAKSWRTIGSLSIGRRQHVAAFINNREILVVGGRHSNLTTMKDAEIFDITTGTSRTAASFPFPINSAVAGYASNGTLVVLGGRDGGYNSYREEKVYRYDRSTDRWVEYGAISEPLQALQMLKLWDGRLVVSGGSRAESPEDFSKDVQIESDGRWSLLGRMTSEREWHSMAQWNEDTIMAIGGHDNGIRELASTNWIDLRTGTITPGPPLNIRRSYFSAFSVPIRFDAAGKPVEAEILAISGIDTMGRSITRTVEILERCTIPAPTLRASNSIIECGTREVTLSVDGTYSGYNWSTGERTPTINVREPGIYWVTVVKDSECVATASIPVKQDPKYLMVDAGYYDIICPGSSTRVGMSRPAFGGVEPYRYRWYPTAGLDAPDSPNPTASPTQSIVYTLEVTDARGCVATDQVRIDVDRPRTVHAHIDTTFTGEPGDEIVIPVHLDDTASAQATGFTYTMRYDSNMMRLLNGTPEDGASGSSLTTGTLVDGWEIDVITERPGFFAARITAPAGGSGLGGPGTLMNLRFATFMRASEPGGGPWLDTSRIYFTVVPDDGPCIFVLSQPGFVRLSACGLSTRLIERLPGAFALEQNRPNPFNPSTRIAFGIPLDGPALLTVHNGSGEEVARLVDGDLAAGKYEVEWDAGAFPSGLYFYRLRTGAWSSLKTMMLLK